MALLFEQIQKLAHGFSAFWARYPNRKAKKDAAKAWDQVVTTPEIEEEIHHALDWQIPEWAAMTWYTPPLPATYLRNERWTDEPTKPKTISPATVTRHVTMAEQQLDARNRIHSLIATGMSPEEAKDQVYRAIGWVKD